MLNITYSIRFFFTKFDTKVLNFIFCLVDFVKIGFSNSQLDKEDLTSEGEITSEKTCAFGEGIPAPAPAPAAAASGAVRASDVSYTTSIENNSSSNVKPLGEDSPLLPVFPSFNDGDGGGPSPQEGANTSESRAAAKRAKASASEIERANKAPLRFFLVREGHKFVPVGGNRRKGAWRELPSVHGSHGVPVVLDPSPYQVFFCFWGVIFFRGRL